VPAPRPGSARSPCPDPAARSGFITPEVIISALPAEVEDHTVPGTLGISMLLSGCCSDPSLLGFAIADAVPQHGPLRVDASSGEGDERLLVGLALGALS
jgi:hypothetical protein